MELSWRATDTACVTAAERTQEKGRVHVITTGAVASHARTVPISLRGTSVSSAILASGVCLALCEWAMMV
jgi:hypothetical protein